MGDPVDGVLRRRSWWSEIDMTLAALISARVSNSPPVEPVLGIRDATAHHKGRLNAKDGVKRQ